MVTEGDLEVLFDDGQDNKLSLQITKFPREKFKELSKGRNETLSNNASHHAQQLAARDRARKLSFETNRRRRALELKKRLEAQKETRRREEVLEERRKRQQEATQKFQRGQRSTPGVPTNKLSGNSCYSAPLQDGIQIAHGQQGDSSSKGLRKQYGTTPNLDDALRLVGNGGYSKYSSYGSYGSTAPSGHIGTTLCQQDYSQSDSSLHRKYGMDSNANPTSTAGAGYHGYSTSATPTYTSNHGTPVGQFQHTLQEQQRKFIEEQEKSLREFNDAILQETTPNSDVLERSASLSSLDSLEEQPQRPSKTNIVENSRYSLPKPSCPAVTVGYYTQGQYSSPSVAKVYPQPKWGLGSNNEIDSAPGKLFVSNQRMLDAENGSVTDHHKQHSNGELKVEDTSEIDIVSEPVEDRKPMLLKGYSQHLRSNLPRSYANGIGIGGHSLARTSEAWGSPAKPKSTYPESEHSGLLSGTANPNLVSMANNAKNRQFSAKTSATVFTVVPNTSGSDISHPTHQVMSSPYRITESTGNKAKEGTVKSSGKEQSGIRFDETPTTDRPPPKAGNKKNTHQPVRSILKNTISEQPAKLGGFQVKDSLEISKSSSVGQKSGKKSVRWGDTDYKVIDRVDDDTGKVQNDHVKDAHVEYSNDAESSAPKSVQQQHTRPMSAVSGDIARRDNRIASASVGQRRSQKSKSNNSDSSGYTAAFMAKKQVDDLPTSSSAAVTSKPVCARNLYKTSSKPTKTNNTSVKDASVNGPNGLCLHKTPTDAEINWLWDKVRTCLNSRDETESDHASKVSERPPSGQSRQLASVSNQCIDGGRITANLRIKDPPSRANSAIMHSRNNGVPRWRTNSDSGTYLRRTALLHQRRQHSAINRGQGGGSTHPPRQGSAHKQPVPTNSHQGPSCTVTAPPQKNYENEVSDSLLAFQRVERLANEDGSETEMGVVMDNHRTPGNQDKVPISALSMEEQRILESLDRLNDRLRSVTSEVSSPYMAITPKPPPFGSGFRGHRPLSSKQQQIVPVDQALLLSSRVRASSADRSNVRMNIYH